MDLLFPFRQVRNWLEGPTVMRNRAAIAQNDTAIAGDEGRDHAKDHPDRVEQGAKHVKRITISAENATNARKVVAITSKIRRFRRI